MKRGGGGEVERERERKRVSSDKSVSFSCYTFRQNLVRVMSDSEHVC